MRIASGVNQYIDGTGTMNRGRGFPILRALGGAMLVLAGVLAYYGIAFGVSSVLVLIFGGGVALVVVLLGQRPHGWDVAIFIIGVLAVGGVTAGYYAGPQVASYSATRTQMPSSVLSISVTSGTGSVSVGFTNRTDTAYEVNVTSSPWTVSFHGPGADSVTNSTRGGVFNLNVNTDWSSVSLLLGRGYTIDLEVTTGTGSVDLAAPGNENLRNISLHSSTGSVSALVDSSAIQELDLSADTGSVTLVSHHLGAAAPRVPVTMSASTGSVNLQVVLESHTAASISASTGLGSISNSLSGFIVTQNTRTSLAATAGDMSSAHASFVITATASLGSVDLVASIGSS